MSNARLVVGPFNRVEGDLEVHLDIADGAVTSARVNAPLYRGFERMLEGRDPRDALTITPRICGICSISQSAAAARALAAAMGLAPTPQGARVAGLIHAVENVCDHLTHFYLFFMPDFARPVYSARPWHRQVVERFTAMQGSGARNAVTARAKLMHILGLLAGKWPHTLAIQPGGVTRRPSAAERVRIRSDLRGFRRFLENELFGAPVEEFIALTAQDKALDWGRGDAGLFLRLAGDLDLAQMGKGAGRYLSFGAYPGPEGHGFAPGLWQNEALRAPDTDAIVEDVSHAWMLGAPSHPSQGQTEPDLDMRDTAYSWCKAPRMGGQPMECGAFARQLIDGHPLARDMAAQGGGVLARVAARLLEIARTQLLMEDMAHGIDPDASFMQRADLPRDGQGVGLVEAARGALGHWLRIENGRIASYQIIAPTTWNFSPRDAAGTPGPLEAALVGAPVAAGEDTPIAVQHIVRSFDPCMVCTVH
ncbi:Periplasmic [NiFeSe] hydrogenase large subunit [Roseibaca ekhonensis]|uniref:Periplasmic [NiFeSe] hydrogenase large subunit n=1 Tax=Roseinatronobacter ekhonensis TaxID=254356 RepID=A0A3B0M9I5_9RHOB|nr:nickel-dependent hydrogenase large subunit [Roseibaca ekhonensis]SUZ32040.1 Periplasmic [NiFeSe] hydrogenase large subunit [Roseibaca ekhonensis]